MDVARVSTLAYCVCEIIVFSLKLAINSLSILFWHIFLILCTGKFYGMASRTPAERDNIDIVYG